MNETAEHPQLWRYNGPGGGKGQLHRIISNKNGEVITLTHSADWTNERERVWSWLGSKEEFEKQFTS